jgi:hypothetical protein
MKSSKLYKPSLSFGLLLQGKPKTGKTTICLAFPGVYIADCDNNLGGAVRRYRELRPDMEFKYDTINQADDGSAIPSADRWNRLVECCKAAAADPTVRTIVVDSLSEVNDYLCDYIVASKPATEEKQMTIKDWVPYKSLMTKFVTTFRSVGKLFIMTCHELAEKDEGSGVLIYKPHMQSKLQDNFGGFFSDVWLTVSEKLGKDYQYYVKTMPETRRALGNSLGLPENFVFTWTEFEQYLAKNADALVKASIDVLPKDAVQSATAQATGTVSALQRPSIKA